MIMGNKAFWVVRQILPTEVSEAETDFYYSEAAVPTEPRTCIRVWGAKGLKGHAKIGIFREVKSAKDLDRTLRYWKVFAGKGIGTNWTGAITPISWAQAYNLLTNNVPSSAPACLKCQEEGWA